MNQKNNSTTMAFIGGGNLATSLIGGLIANKFKASNIIVAEPNEERRSHLTEQFKVRVTAKNNVAANEAECIILAVKPQIMREIMENIRLDLSPNSLLISVAAGITTANISTWLKKNLSIIRAMPNTPALINEAMTGLYANQYTNQSQRELAESILAAVGQTAWVEDEEKIDVITAVSGSGPAYFFLFIEALENSAINLGIEPSSARKLALQTAYGACKLANLSDHSPAALRKQVTSPGGTTEKALATMQKHHIKEIIHQAVHDATSRAKELSSN